MEHLGESLPGWSLGRTKEGGRPYAKLETESGDSPDRGVARSIAY